MRGYKALPFVLTVLIAIFCVGCKGQNEFSPVSVPYSYSFTDFEEKIIDLQIFVDSKKAKICNAENISDLQLVAGEETVPAKISGPILTEEEPIGTYEGKDIYLVALPLLLGSEINSEMLDVHLRVEYVDGSSQDLLVGDISRVLANYDTSVNEDFDFISLNPIGYSDEDDIYKLSTFYLHVILNEAITLSTIDLGLSKYGFDLENILVFSGEEDLDMIKGLIADKSIILDYPDLFALPIQDTVQSNIGCVSLSKGEHILILPLVVATKRNNSIIQTGAKLEYSARGQKKQYIMPSKTMFGQTLWNLSAVKRFSEKP